MTQKKGQILFVTDERLSRERTALLMRVINASRQFAHVEVLSGATTEDELIKKLENKHYDLVLTPWYRYLAWSKVEAFYGLTRTSGPTFAGYFCDQVQPYELGPQADHLRAILLDFNCLSVSEACHLLRSLLVVSNRAGIRPLTDASSAVYCETWYTGQGLGLRLDAVLGLPEIANSDWSKRASELRICMGALWGLVYEIGPGKTEFGQMITSKSAKAYFQVSADTKTLVLRLCYGMPTWSPKDAVSTFWPDPKNPAGPAQLLLKHCDFLRVHTVAETNDVEVVAGFFNSAVSTHAFGQIHSLWVEPIAVNLMKEIPYEAPNPLSPHLKALPVPQLGESKVKGSFEVEAEASERAKDRFIREATAKLRELSRQVTERDDLIRELKMGGVGTAAPPPLPDAEALLEAFQERYFDAKYQIRQLELQVELLEKKGGTPEEIEMVRTRIQTLMAREQSWIKKIASFLEAFRETMRKASGGG